MTIDIKLTHEQHDMLLAQLGSEEAIHDWLQTRINNKITEMQATYVSHAQNMK